MLPGTNTINPDCNLEEWEGITSGNREIRDDVKTQGIRDGIDDGYGHSFDTLAGEHGQENVKDGHQFCETTWCFTGTLSKNYQWTKTSGDITFFKKYTNGGTRPILVFMDTSRGALYAYAHYTNASGQEIENFLNENEKCDGDSPSAKDPSDALQMKFLEKFKSQHASFTALLAQLNRKYYPDFYPAEEFDGIEYDAYQDKGNRQEPAAGVHKAAFRRLKLFKAAEHLGAQIFRTPKWIAAVCKKDQIQPFGRYKPIASKDDPAMPDPRYNLEDWEGITAEDKKIRDRINFDECLKYDCVRDGVNDGYGIGFDHLEGHSGQNPKKIKFAESCWCLCGALSGQ